jgi:hypothetical protein
MGLLRRRFKLREANLKVTAAKNARATSELCRLRKPARPTAALTVSWPTGPDGPGGRRLGRPIWGLEGHGGLDGPGPGGRRRGQSLRWRRGDRGGTLHLARRP